MSVIVYSRVISTPLTHLTHKHHARPLHSPTEQLISTPHDRLPYLSDSIATQPSPTIQSPAKLSSMFLISGHYPALSQHHCTPDPLDWVGNPDRSCKDPSTSSARMLLDTGACTGSSGCVYTVVIHEYRQDKEPRTQHSIMVSRSRLTHG